MSFTAGQSPEVLVDSIIAYLRTNIEDALASVRSDRADARIATPKPVQYFVSEQTDPHQCPAVFVIPDNIDWQKEQKGANFAPGKTRINISVVCEDRVTETLTRMVYRYAAAVKTLADQTNLTSANNKVTMAVVVNRTSFSPLYTDAQKKGQTSGVFRKEVVLECDVFHYENF